MALVWQPLDAYAGQNFSQRAGGLLHRMPGAQAPDQQHRRAGEGAITFHVRAQRTDCSEFANPAFGQSAEARPAGRSAGHEDDIQYWIDKGDKEMIGEGFFSDFKQGVTNIFNKSVDTVKNVYNEIKDRLDAVINGRDSNPNTRLFLKEHEKENVISIDLFRQPINKTITGLMHVISEGKTSENQRKLGYDDLYHLGMKIGLSNGKFYSMEKNETIKFSDWQNQPDMTFQRVILNQPINMGEFFLNGYNYAKKHNIPFFVYNVESANCQYFVSCMLHGNSPKVTYSTSNKKFVMQDIMSLLESSPIVRRLALTLPKIKDSFNILLHGRSE